MTLFNVRQALATLGLFVCTAAVRVQHANPRPPSGLQAASRVWASLNSDKAANAATNFVLIFQGNHAFAPMLESWLCNTVHMAGLHKRTLLVMTDESGYSRLVGNRYGVAVGLADAGDPSLLHDMAYGTVGYWKLTQARVKLLHQLLSAGIPFMNWEPDAFWARNPLADWSLLAARTDIVIASDGPDELAFGLMLVRANPRTRRLFHKLSYQLLHSLRALNGRDNADNVSYSSDFQEQKLLKRLLVGGFANATYTLLPQCLYPTGKWYRVDESAKLRHACIASHGPPIVINNNWIVGNDRKVERAKQWGHWFVDGQGRCDEDAVVAAIAQHTAHPI
jgi:Nucleotide-diphospho-sugar transferase